MNLPEQAANGARKTQRIKRDQTLLEQIYHKEQNSAPPLRGVPSEEERAERERWTYLCAIEPVLSTSVEHGVEFAPRKLKGILMALKDAEARNGEQGFDFPFRPINPGPELQSYHPDAVYFTRAPENKNYIIHPPTLSLRENGEVVFVNENAGNEISVDKGADRIYDSYSTALGWMRAHRPNYHHAFRKFDEKVFTVLNALSALLSFEEQKDSDELKAKLNQALLDRNIANLLGESAHYWEHLPAKKFRLDIADYGAFPAESQQHAQDSFPQHRKISKRSAFEAGTTQEIHDMLVSREFSRIRALYTLTHPGANALTNPQIKGVPSGPVYWLVRDAQGNPLTQTGTNIAHFHRTLERVLDYFGHITISGKTKLMSEYRESVWKPYIEQLKEQKFLG